MNQNTNTKKDFRTFLLRTIIDATKGQIFSVKFIKANGEERDMVCRTGVRKGINGNGYSMSKAKRLIRWRVWDLHKAAWRTIPIDRIISIKASRLKIAQN